MPAPAAEPRPSPPAPRPLRQGYAWYVAGALTSMYMLSFVDRQILSLLVGPIKRDLGVSDTRIGLLQGLAFALFYTLVGLPMGRIADRSNRRNLIAASIVVWSAFASLCSVARSFWTLFLTRIGVGVGEAGLSPAAYSLLTDYFPNERLGVAVSIYYMGVFLGSSLALLVGGMTVDALARTPVVHLPVLGTLASWRLTFLIVGLPGLLFALLASTIREPLRRGWLARADGQPRQLSFPEAVSEIRARWRSVAGISLGMVAQSMFTYSVTAWGPAFFQRVHGWTPGQSGRALAMILATFGCLGMYIGGTRSDRLQKRGVPEGPLKVAVWSAIGAGILTPIAMLLPNAAWTLALLGPAFFFIGLPMGVAAAALQQIFPNQVRGQVSALFLFILNLGGLTLGAGLPGFLNDRLFHNEKMIGDSVALTAAAAGIVMLALFRVTFGSYRSDYLRMRAPAPRS